MRPPCAKALFVRVDTAPEPPAQCVEDTLTLEGRATLDFTEDYLRYVSPYLEGNLIQKGRGEISRPTPA